MNAFPQNKRLDEVVKSYKDKRIRYIKSTQNTGISEGRNKLMRLAKGKYFAVMDHDDVCLPSRFEEEVNVLDKHPEIGVVGCWVEKFPVTKIVKYPEKKQRY